MRKKITAVFAVIAIIASALCFSACHGTKVLNGFTVPEEFDESQNYEITFWAKNDNNKYQTDIYNKSIEDFEKLYPNIKVNIKLYTDYTQIYNDVITNISTETTPNVCITYPDHIATYITGENVVVPLDTLAKNNKYGLGGSEVKFDSPEYKELIPQYLEECQINKTLYALPFMRSTEACYVNKTFVEKLGYELPEVLTWDFVWEVSDAAMKTDKNGNYVVNGQKIMIPFIYKSTDNMMISMLKQKDAGYSDDAGNVLLFNDTTREILTEVADHAGKKSFSTFKISSYPANFLNAGQCIFAVDSTAGSTWMGCDAPLSDISADKIVEFETAVMTIPQYDTKNIQMISQGPSLCIFNKSNPEEVLASWLFAQYLLSNDVQLAYAETEGYVPVTSKAQNSDKYKEYLSHTGETSEKYYDIKIKASKLLIDNVENTFVTSVFNGATSLRNAAGELIENVVKSKRRNETVDDDYFDKMFNDVLSLYRLDSVTFGSSEENDLGKLPLPSIILICVLAALWIGFIIYRKCIKAKKRKDEK